MLLKQLLERGFFLRSLGPAHAHRSVYDWVTKNVEFYANAGAPSMNADGGAYTQTVRAPFKNLSDQTVEFAPVETVHIGQERSWHVTDTSTTSVTLSAKIGVEAQAVSAEVRTEISISGTLEKGAGETETYLTDYTWGAKVAIPGHQSGEFVMDIVSQRYKGSVQLTINADVKPDVQDLVYQDEFQGNNLFTWSRLLAADKQWTATVNLAAAMSTSNTSRWQPIQQGAPALA